jgi:hypothetical protein
VLSGSRQSLASEILIKRFRMHHMSFGAKSKIGAHLAN